MMRTTMMTCRYKIAGKTAAVTSLYPDVHELCADYRTDGAPDFAVEITSADIEYEDAISRREDAIQGRRPAKHPPRYWNVPQSTARSRSG